MSKTIALVIALAACNGSQPAKDARHEILSYELINPSACASGDPCSKCCAHGEPWVCGRLADGGGLCVYETLK